MSDADNGAGAGAGTGSEGSEGSAGAEGKGTEGKGGEDEFDRDRAMKTIEAQRESEKALKKELGEARAALKKLEKDRESDEEKTRTAEERIAAMEAKLASGDTRVAKQALRAAAAAAGAIYPEDIPRLVSGEVEFDDDGEPTNADDLVEALKKSKPALFGTARPGSADGGARGGGDGGKVPTMDERLRAAAGRS